jgi:hypothetical protein
MLPKQRQMSVTDRDSTNRREGDNQRPVGTEEAISSLADRVIAWLAQWAVESLLTPEHPLGVLERLLVETGLNPHGCLPSERDELWSGLRAEVARRSREGRFPDLLAAMLRYEEALRFWGTPTTAGLMFWSTPERR